MAAETQEHMNDNFKLSWILNLGVLNGFVKNQLDLNKNALTLTMILY